MYVQMDVLMRWLSKLDPRRDHVYMGRASNPWRSLEGLLVKGNATVAKPGVPYDFALGGLYCLSRAMLTSIAPYLGYVRIMGCGRGGGCREREPVTRQSASLCILIVALPKPLQMCVLTLVKPMMSHWASSLVCHPCQDIGIHNHPDVCTCTRTYTGAVLRYPMVRTNLIHTHGHNLADSVNPRTLREQVCATPLGAGEEGVQCVI